ncbi:centrosome-associated zinc finger protein CP190-like [Macrosteles quadrilineatus]|uniref:centrosome-associated zinc finger protein CP190-like n=1 Tax=Macrosteles quadrilineatus TaxID=74068 RepID=UPI0023E3293A|nr:centrosome-associated zinc finger protein CP190-like [Macrosteles quadrilineatus]
MVTESKEKKTFILPKWEEYVVSKMNQLYNKSELCDVTLKFPNDTTIIQAHKVILKACSGFFDVLPPASGAVVLHMPKNIKPAHVRALIDCMYTGKLEYVAGEKSRLCLVAKQLGMNYIIEILQKQSASVPSSQLHNVAHPTIKRYISKQHQATPTGGEVSETSPSHSPSISPTPTSSSQTSTPTSSILPGKKLPIWKQRTTINIPEEFCRSVTRKPLPPPPVHVEPKPSRFELCDEEGIPDFTETFENLSYESQVIITPCEEPKPVVSVDSVERMPTMSTLGKRARASEVIRGSTEEDDYDDGHFESIHDIDDDGDEEDSIAAGSLKPTTPPPKPILKTFSSPSPSKKVRFAVSSETKTVATPSNPQPVNHSHSASISIPVTTPTSLPISSSQTTTTSLTTNTSPTTSTTPASPPTSTPSVIQKISSPASASTAAAVSTPATPQSLGGAYNHANIINTVLKKFPDLMKNKNIKLKIQGSSPVGFSSSTNSLDKDGKSKKKVQYLVLKSDLNNLKKEVKEPSNGAENTTGPWSCITCATEDGPLKFETYYNYRRHLQEIHNERIDARICEYCGHKASKRNLHLYHLYTKHNIAPPRNIHFPKCDQCNYIALSESLLIKHRSNHTGMITKEFICRLCNAAFKSHGALMGHMQTNLHQTDQAAKKDYECEYCGKIFNRNINLKAHIRSSHQEESIRKMYDDEDKAEDSPEVENPSQEKKGDQTMDVIEVPVFDSVSGQNQTIYLPQGMTILTENPSVPLMPSSESEAMNNVATGIATSINITDRNMPNDVLVIDGGSTELILRGAPTAYVMNPDGTYSLQEYIVPEIMADSGQVYTTALVSSAPSTGITYVNSDNISIISPSDHTYADGMKVNGHVATGTPVTIVSSVDATSNVQTVTQANQSIIVQEPILVNADWMQKISSQNETIQLSQTQTQNMISQPMLQKVEIISSQPISQSQKIEIISQSVSQKDSLSQISQPLLQISSDHQTESESSTKTAQTLVSDWADLDEDHNEESEDIEDESEKKPSRPTIELEPNNDEIGM